MTNQIIIVTTLIFWILLNLWSLTSPLRRNLSKQPALNKPSTLSIILLEVIAVILAFSKSRMENLYLLLFGVSLLFIGWIISNNRLVSPQYDKKRLLRLRDNIFSLLGIHRDFHYLALSGDWLQLIGLSLVLSSLYGLIFSLILFPIIIHFTTISLMPPRSNTTDPHVIQATNSFVWPGWRLVVRIVSINIIFLLFLAFLNNDLILFKGNLQNARSLLETLVQTEVTVFALVITFLFVIIEFTNATYTPRLSNLVFNRISFRALLFFSTISILFKITILSNEDWLTKLLINYVLFCTIASVISFILFTRDVIYLMQPEVLVNEALRQFDHEWINVIKDQWGSESTPRTLYPDRDPLFVIERILVASLEKGDINSFQTTLIQLREKIKFVCKPDDRVFLDIYLANGLFPVVLAASKHHLDLALKDFCETIADITEPSLNSIKSFETNMFHPPPGCSSIVQILDCAIESQMLNSAMAATRALKDRATDYLSWLPSQSELYSLNYKNYQKEISEELKIILQRNDRRVDDYQDGFLRYFGKVGVKAIKSNMPFIAHMVTSYLSEQLCKIIEKIPDKSYQHHLLIPLWWAFNDVRKSACEKKVQGAISLGGLAYDLRKIVDKDIAMMISEQISKQILSLSKVGLLDWAIVVDVAVSSTDLASANPNTVLPILEAFEKGGKALMLDYSEDEDMLFVIQEMNRRIDQIENRGLTFSIKTKVSRAANKARKIFRN